MSNDHESFRYFTDTPESSRQNMSRWGVRLLMGIYLFW